MTAYIILWFLIGFVSNIMGTMLTFEKLSIRDALLSLAFSFFGVIVLIFLLIKLFEKVDWSFLDKVIWSKKK